MIFLDYLEEEGIIELYANAREAAFKEKEEIIKNFDVQKKEIISFFKSS